MPSIKLFELAPTRSARVRWMLLEVELPSIRRAIASRSFATPNCAAFIRWASCLRLLSTESHCFFDPTAAKSPARPGCPQG